MLGEQYSTASEAAVLEYGNLSIELTSLVRTHTNNARLKGSDVEF